MEHNIHKKVTKIIFGNEYKEVHRFLDQFILLFGNHSKLFLHHKEGLDIIEKIFNKKIRDVSELHIRMDYAGHLPTLKELLDKPYTNEFKGLKFKEPIKVLKNYKIIGG